jgi:hypothetical protein
MGQMIKIHRAKPIRIQKSNRWNKIYFSGLVPSFHMIHIWNNYSQNMPYLPGENHSWGIDANQICSDLIILYSWNSGEISLAANRFHRNSYLAVTIVATILTGHSCSFNSAVIFANHFPLSVGFHTPGESRPKDSKISTDKSHDAWKLEHFGKNDQNGFSDVAEATKFIHAVRSQMESYINRAIAIPSRYGMKK